MTRPDWCPENVWEAADETHHLMSTLRNPGREAETAEIARAIFAERERCAKIADDLAHLYRAIAAAIRGGV